MSTFQYIAQQLIGKVRIAKFILPGQVWSTYAVQLNQTAQGQGSWLGIQFFFKPLKGMEEK